MRSESPCWIAWASDVMKSSLLSILEITLNKTLLPDLDESVVVFLESILLIRSKWGSSKPPEIKACPSINRGRRGGKTMSTLAEVGLRSSPRSMGGQRQPRQPPPPLRHVVICPHDWRQLKLRCLA